MIRFASTRGGISPVTFDEAVLQGFAADGGLFVPDSIPQITESNLQSWANLSFQDLAFEILSLFIDPDIIPENDLKQLLDDSYSGFEHHDVIKLVPYESCEGTYIMELFHGPTLSFKDVAMGFLMNVLDYFLKKRNQHLNIILATTGDTGPAAAWAAAGKKTIDCWPLYPRGMISDPQERQMTTLGADNVHPLGVENCPDGGDDLDLVVAKLFADENRVKKLNLSSVNSINWCRVMMQSVHYFYGYFRVVEKIGEKVVFSVPSGAFGNSFAGYLARAMGLPVETFICANNTNQALHTAFSQGVFEKKDLIQTASSAIDICVPYNFWRFLYFSVNGDSNKIKQWMDEFESSGHVALDRQTQHAICDGFMSTSISDQQTREIIKQSFEHSNSYLLDPHTAVAVAASSNLKEQLPASAKVVCVATAHPSKFPDVIKRSLGVNGELPVQARHDSLDKASKVCQHLRLCHIDHLEHALIDAMTTQAI